ncbi:PEP-CTERM sorting domain-containing protein [Pseudorhodoferax sp.]|uniref:PEP-CTERM sorting domain-containing protein n=1 Tax=Pseudorhodoferax sp. TaxID=1993553 RepID=UPI002DD693C8|nr:PEP-CTERM sorting domain-containing protein [Pseudorhodoferax sp.]
MTALTSSSRRGGFVRPLIAAALLAGSTLPAQALTYTFGGTADSGPLAGHAYEGSLSFADPAAGFSGSIELTAFTLDFNGQSYTLESADWTPVAQFDAGSFLGVDYTDIDSGDPGVRAHVTLTADWFDVSGAFLTYTTSAADGGTGFGSLVFVTTPVPEPGSITLMLGGLVLLGGLMRRTR